MVCSFPFESARALGRIIRIGWGLWDPRRGGTLPGRDVGGGGVIGLGSRREITDSESKGTRPVALKPAHMLLAVIEVLNASTNALKKSSFVMWVICMRIICSICLLYKSLSRLKHPTSRGWRK